MFLIEILLALGFMWGVWGVGRLYIFLTQEKWYQENRRLHHRNHWFL